MKFLLINGRLRLANGRPVVMEPGVAAPSSGALTLSLTPFYVAKAGIQPVIQRKRCTEYGDVPVLFSFTGEQPTNVQARVVAAGTGAVIRNWATLENVSVDGANMVGTLADVPIGESYLLEIRDATQPSNPATTKTGLEKWGVGAIALAQGQSNMLNTLAGNFADIVPSTSQSEYAYYNAGNVAGAVFDNVGWHAPSNGSNGPTGLFNNGNTATGNIIRFIRIVSARLSAKHGRKIPVGIVPWAFSNQPISTFLPASGGQSAGVHWNNLFAASGTSGTTIGLSSPRSVYAGDYEMVFWHQGEADQNRSTADYLVDLTKLRQSHLDYVSQFGRDASTLFFGAGVLGNYAVSACPSIENIRRAVLDSGWATWTTIDLVRTGTDTLHFNGTGGYPQQKRSMMRVIQSALKWLGCATFSGRGPRITTTTVAQAGNAAVLAVEHEGGTALVPAVTGSAITGFYANSAPDFTGTDVAVTATITGPAQITLTFPVGTAYPVYVKHLGGRIGSTVVDGQGYTASCNPNIGNLVYDNVQYPTGATGTDVEAMGLPLLPTAGAITVTGG